MMKKLSTILVLGLVSSCARVHEPSIPPDQRSVADEDAGPDEQRTLCSTWFPPVPTRQLSAGANHVCVLGIDGRVRCWGDGANGQLGQGSHEGSGALVEAVGISDAAQISAGGGFTCATLPDGTLRCWGGLGVGPRPGGARSRLAGSTTPALVEGLTDVVSVSAGGTLACILHASGEVSCWGEPTQAEPCAGGCRPARVAGLSDTIAVDAGYSHACALDAMGTVRCWGDGRSGQLANRSREPSLVPVEIPLDLPATQIVTGDSHSCAILVDGTVRCWGDNQYGQLGVGTTEPQTLPVHVPGLEGVQDIEAGRHTCATTATETLCWGNNRYGELFDGTTEPHALPGPTDVRGDVDAHSVITCSLRSDDSVKCCGRVTRGVFLDR